MSNRLGAAFFLAALGLTACATTPPPRAAAIPINQDPYPSTYVRYPSTMTVIRGATVFDGEGGRIDHGLFVDSAMELIESKIPAPTARPCSERSP